MVTDISFIHGKQKVGYFPCNVSGIAGPPGLLHVPHHSVLLAGLSEDIQSPGDTFIQKTDTFRSQQIQSGQCVCSPLRRDTCYLMGDIFASFSSTTTIPMPCDNPDAFLICGMASSTRTSTQDTVIPLDPLQASMLPAQIVSLRTKFLLLVLNNRRAKQELVRAVQSPLHIPHFPEVQTELATTQQSPEDIDDPRDPSDGNP
ncbi:hypothetical protein B0H14DRAFT_2557970 [Mycena olivaceomarginata]|nr:hypothetical protein B0H14DRAFT_2557970 [Mycena olivaceomarginata]